MSWNGNNRSGALASPFTTFSSRGWSTRVCPNMMSAPIHGYFIGENRDKPRGLGSCSKKKMFRHCTHLWCLQNPDGFPQDSFLASQPWRHGEPMEFPMTWRMLRVEGEKWECESKCATPSGNSTQLWKFPICLILSVGKSSCLSSIHEPFFLAILSNNQRVSRVHWKQGTYPKTSWVIIIIMWFSSWKNVLLTIPHSNTRAYYPKKINDPILCVRWKEHAQKPTLW